MVLFGPLPRDEVREIARNYLATVEQTLTAAGKTLRVEDEALDLMASQGYSLADGARFLKRVIDERGKLPISARWGKSSQFRVRVTNGEVTV